MGGERFFVRVGAGGRANFTSLSDRGTAGGLHLPDSLNELSNYSTSFSLDMNMLYDFISLFLNYL